MFADDFFAVKQQVIEEAKLKLGFGYFTPLIYLQNVGYSDSIYNYENEKTPDWTGDFGLGLRASSVVGDRFILTAEDLPVYSYYQKTEEQRAWSNRFQATTYTYLSLFNFKARYTHNYVRQRPSLEFGRPFHFTNQQWSGEVDYGRHDFLFVTAYFKANKYDYGVEPYLTSYNLDERLSHNETILGLNLNKRIFSQTTLYANYEHTDYAFANNPGRDSRAQQVALGVRLPEIGAIQGSFYLGFKRFNPANPAYRNVSRPTGRGDVSRMRLNLFYEIQTHFSYSSVDNFYDNQSFGGGIETRLTRFLKAGATYQDGRMKHYSFLDLSHLHTDRVRQQQYYLAVPFVLNTSIGFSYNIYRLTSGTLGYDITRKFWGGFLSYEF